MTQVVASSSHIFHIVVDYGKSLSEMIAAGQYSCKNDNIIMKNFPISGESIVEFEGCYFHFETNISSKNAIDKIESVDASDPWLVAKIEHLLLHGSLFPNEQCKFPVIGLGSVAEINNDFYIPFLCNDVFGRSVYLYWHDIDWPSASRFLAVRKI